MRSKTYALITGASSGLGKYLALEMASKGYSLVLVALPGTGLQQVKTAIVVQNGTEVHMVETDLTDECGPGEVWNYCHKQQLNVGILINNAGIGLESSFDNTPIAYCSTLMQLNTLAVVKMTRLFLPSLKTHPNSYILNVSSLASYTPMPFKGIYAASKAFINSFSCSLRTELKGTGVSISVLCPGGIPTNEQTRSRIMNHGWFARAGMIEPDRLAAIAVRKMFRGNQVIIPGRLNRISKLLMQLLPTAIQQEILYRSYVDKVNIKLA